MTDSDSSEYEDESVDNDGQWFSKPPPPPTFCLKSLGDSSEVGNYPGL